MLYKPSNEAGGRISAFPSEFISAPKANPDRSPPSGTCAICGLIRAGRLRAIVRDADAWLATSKPYNPKC